MDVIFFTKVKGKLRQLPAYASDKQILNAAAATLRSLNQKSGHKGKCVSHHVMEGIVWECTAWVLGRRIVHVRNPKKEVLKTKQHV